MRRGVRKERGLRRPEKEGLRARRGKPARRSVGNAAGKSARRARWISWAYMSPSLAGVLVFFVLPFCVVVYYAFVDNPISQNFVFFRNFANILHNAAFLQAAKNTLLFSVVTVPLAVLLSLGLAILLEKRIPFRSQFRTFFLSPMMVPIASIVLIWQVLFHYNGAINGVLGWFGLSPIDWLKSDYGQVAIGVLFLWKNLGYNMILFMAGLANIPRELVEVAMLDTSSALAQFFYVKLRYLSPTIFFVTILSLINSFKIFREVYLLTGDYPYDSLYMLQTFMNNTFASLDYQKLSAAAVVMAVFMVIVIGILFLAEERYGKDVEG